MISLDLLAPFLGSFIRHGLSVAAGVLVTKGVLDQAAAESAANGLTEMSVGLLSYAIAQGMSLVKAKKAKK